VIILVSQAEIASSCGSDILGVPWGNSSRSRNNLGCAHLSTVGLIHQPVQRGSVNSIARQTSNWCSSTMEAFSRCVYESRLRPGSAFRLRSFEPAKPDSALPVLGVFVAWACERGLLDPAALSDHAELCHKVRTRRAQGSELVRAAMPRGFWTSYLVVDRPCLRQHTMAWFSSYWDHSIIKDFISAFGEGEGKFGHTEPNIETES
jgi:hypothetical protein